MDKILGNKFIGTFTKESQENSDEFLKALGNLNILLYAF